jgi:hypothetical protein
VAIAAILPKRIWRPLLSWLKHGSTTLRLCRPSLERDGPTDASGRGRGRALAVRARAWRARTQQATEVLARRRRPHPTARATARALKPQRPSATARASCRPGASACHRTVAGAARWHIRRRSGPHDGAYERPARGARPGTNRAPARPPQAGEFTVARTRVLIKKTSHPERTCVLIICMSQATRGPWPRSDVIPRCRQNGPGALSGVVGDLATCHDWLGDAGVLRPGGERAWRPGGGEMWRPPGGAPQRCRGGALRRPWHPCDGTPGPAGSGSSGRQRGRSRWTVRADATAGGPRLPRSLTVPQGGPQTAADGRARPPPARARAPR